MKLQPGQSGTDRRTSGRTDALTHIQSKVENCGNFVSLSANGLDKNFSSRLGDMERTRFGKDRRTDRQTNRRTDIQKKISPKYTGEDVIKVLIK